MGRLGAPARDLDHIGTPVAWRQLDDAQPVAMVVKAHGLGIDSDRPLIAAEVGEIAAMQANGHDFAPKSPASAIPDLRMARLTLYQAFEIKRLSPEHVRAV